MQNTEFHFVTMKIPATTGYLNIGLKKCVKVNPHSKWPDVDNFYTAYITLHLNAIQRVSFRYNKDSDHYGILKYWVQKVRSGKPPLRMVRC